MIEALRRFWRIKVHVPVDDDRGPTWLGQKDIADNEHVRSVITALVAIPGVGRIGNYDSIYELDGGWEGYRAKPGASPRHGAIGEKIILGSIAVTTYVDYETSSDMFRQVVDAVRAVHPWEHPIIEFGECLLYVPTGRV